MGAKVLGLVHTKNSQSLTVDQIPTDVGIFGNIDKFTNKTQIIKNATAFLRNVSTADQSILTINKTRLSGGTGYGKYITTNTGGVLYF